MAQLKKKTARLILQGISILGILLGFSLVLSAIGTVLGLERDSLTILCGSLVLSAAVLALGVYVIYTSYLMFRWRAFAAITWISVLLALFLFGVAGQWLWLRFSMATSVSVELPHYVRAIGALAVLIGLYLFVSICIRLSQRLLEVAGIRPAKN